VRCLKVILFSPPIHLLAQRQIWVARFSQRRTTNYVQSQLSTGQSGLRSTPPLLTVHLTRQLSTALAWAQNWPNNHHHTEAAYVQDSVNAMQQAAANSLSCGGGVVPFWLCYSVGTGESASLIGLSALFVAETLACSLRDLRDAGPGRASMPSVSSQATDCEGPVG
jgi:hypothetical protein